MAETGTSRTSQTGRKALLMTVAFLLIGGFLWWLSITAEPTSVAIVEEEESADDDPAVPTVELAAFSTDPRQYEGQQIRLRNVPVASMLGQQAFWFQLSNQTPYLVKVDSTLAAAGVDVRTRDRIERVVGTVHVMSDSVLDAWDAQGAFTNETQRIEAEFATSFLQATSLDIAPRQGGGGSGGGSGSGGS